MINDGFTAHAARRLQQRAILPFLVELLERFGTSVRCEHADRLYFDKTARRRSQQHFGGQRGLQLIERWLDVYAVVGDNGRVITVAHAEARHRRS